MIRRAVIVLFWVEALLAAIRFIAALGDIGHPPAGLTTAIFYLLQLGVMVMFASLVSVRGEPVAPNRRVLAMVACIAALGSVALLQAPIGRTPSPNVWGGELISIAGTAWVLFSLWFLGRCFGVLPEARGLVTRGPYGYVRHPVYLGEMAAALGLVAARPETRNLVLGMCFAAAQVIRMRLEEAELSLVFPEYLAYARSTPRLVPRISGIGRPYSRVSASAPTLRRARRT